MSNKDKLGIVRTQIQVSFKSLNIVVKTAFNIFNSSNKSRFYKRLTWSVSGVEHGLPTPYHQAEGKQFIYGCGIYTK